MKHPTNCIDFAERQCPNPSGQKRKKKNYLGVSLSNPKKKKKKLENLLMSLGKTQKTEMS